MLKMQSVQLILKGFQYNCLKEFDNKRKRIEEDEIGSNGTLDEIDKSFMITTEELDFHADDNILGVTQTCFPKSKKWKSLGYFNRKPGIEKNGGESYEKLLFTQLSFKSKLFYYVFTGTKNGKFWKKEVFKVSKTCYKPKPLNYDLVCLILKEVNISHLNGNLMQFLNSDLLKEDPNYRPNDPKFEMKKYVFDKKKIDILAYNHSELFHALVDLKRYFLWDEIDLLTKCFPEECIIGMKWDDIKELHNIIMTTPQKMCFPYYREDGTTFRYKDPDEVMEGVLSILPELSFDNFMNLIENPIVQSKLTLGPEEQAQMIIACCFYDQLKKYTLDSKQVYEHAHILFKDVEKRLNSIFDPSLPEEEKVFSKEQKEFVIDALTRVHPAIVEDENNRIYMKHMYLSQFSIVKCIEYIFSREEINAIKRGYDQIMEEEELFEFEEEMKQEGDIIDIEIIEDESEIINKHKRKSKTKDEIPSKREKREDSDSERKHTKLNKKFIDLEEEVPSKKHKKESKILTFKNHEFCDEQIHALELHRKLPIVIVNGPGGSGKTDFLGAISLLYPSNQVLAVAFQAGNVGDLSCMFLNSYTIHQIIYSHRATCTKDNNPYKAIVTQNCSETQQNRIKKMLGINPEKEVKGEKKYYTKNGKSYCTCILEEYKILVVEEMSLVYQEIFAELLLCLICCGKLEKIIMVGDTSQLPPLKTGNLFQSLYNSLSKMRCVSHFTHNHRVDKNSIVLKENAEQIKAGRGYQVKFDGKASILIHHASIFNQSDEIRLRTLKDKVIEALKEHKVGEYEHHIVTTTNKIRKYLLPFIDRYYHELEYGNEAGCVEFNQRSLWINRKVMFKQNNYDFDDPAINNEIMILEKVIDTKPETGETFERLTTNFELPDGMKRSIVCQVLDGKQKKTKTFPFNDWVKQWLNRATVTTIDGYQGRQKETLLAVIPFYSKFLTRERLYTMFTRPSKRMIFIGNPSDIQKGSQNPEPPRKSVMEQEILVRCQGIAEIISEI